MKYPETAYFSNDIEINIKKRVINNITIYIPLYVKAADAVKIYDAITGYGELRPYEMLDELKKYYPYLKNIDRGEIDNDYIFTEDIGVFYEDTHIRIVVEYNKYFKSVTCHIDDKRVNLINAFSNINKGGNMAKDRFYSWRDINIHVSDGVVDYMKLYIPSDLDQIDIYNIYDIITGYVPDNTLISEERMAIVDNKNTIKKMYFYNLLDELKKYYPSLKEIHRTEIYNTPIYPKDIDVCCKDKTVAITVKYGYTSGSFNIPNLSEIYSAIISERYKLINHLYLITGEITFKFCNSDEKSLEEALNKLYGAPDKDIEKKVQTYCKKVDNTQDDYTWYWRDIKIHASYGTIDEIKLRIPVVAHSGILKNADALRIYDIVTGHSTFPQFNDEEKLIKIDEEKYIKKVQTYNLLDALKKYYPCLEGMHRNKLYDDQLYPKDVNVCCTNDTVIITVKYGYAATCDSFGIPKLLELYSSVYSEYSKLFDHLNSIPDNSNEKIKELKKKINSTHDSATDKELNKGDNNMKIEGKLYFANDIEISVTKGIIDNIKVYIPSYLKINNILKIYATITGYMHNVTDKDIEDMTEQDLLPLCSCGLLSKLEEYYPYVKNINKTELDNVRIYATNTDLYCEDNTIIITVNYIDSYNPFKIPKLSKRYSSMTSDCVKIYNIALREHIKNSTYGAQIDAYCKSDEETINETFKKYIEPIAKTELYKKYINAAFGVPEFSAFDAITDELKDTYIKKNHDYGNSFDKSIDKFGLTAAVVRMNDKMERLNSLLHKDAKVDESIRDTVMDLANYCIMTAMYLDNKKENK